MKLSAVEALKSFRRKHAAGNKSVPSSSTPVESPSMESRPYKTPNVGHIGVFKNLGLANTNKLKTPK